MKRAVLLIAPWVLTAESRLHIQRRRFDIGEHQHRRPLRNGDTRGKLSDRQRDRLIIVVDGITHLVVSLLRFLFLREFAVTGGKHDLIFSENRVCL